MTAFGRGLKAGSFPDVMAGWASPPMGWLGKASSGFDVSTDAALTVSVIYRCILLVGGTLAKLPWHLYRDLPPDDQGRWRGRERASDEPEYPVLHKRFDRQMTSFNGRLTGMFHLLTWGNFYAEQERDGFGDLLALHPLRPDRMEVKWEAGERVYYYRGTAGPPTRLTQDRVFHVPGLSFDGLVGKPPLTLMRETLGSYGAARDYGASFFRNGARPAVVVTHPKTLSTPAIERLSAQMDRLRGSGNAGKTVLLEEGADFKDVGFPPEDAQFIQTKDHELSTFTTWFGVPPHMAGLVDRSTSWGTGIEQQTRGFFDYTMDFHIVNWEQNANAQLLEGRDVINEMNRDAMLRGDTLTRHQVYKIRSETGMSNPNDLLRMENQNPRDDDGGEEYVRPMNFVATGSRDDDGRPVIRLSLPDEPVPATNGRESEPVVDPIR